MSNKIKVGMDSNGFLDWTPEQRKALSLPDSHEMQVPAPVLKALGIKTTDAYVWIETGLDHVVIHGANGRTAKVKLA